MSLFSNFPQGGKKAGVQSISDGGTGATTAEAALANLGGFPKADGEALKTRIQPINLGGTGASEANEARQNLGAAAVKEMTKAEYDALPAIDPTIFYALTDVEADGAKIEVGSYVGTGTYGSNVEITLEANFTPKLFVLAAYISTSGGTRMLLNQSGGYSMQTAVLDSLSSTTWSNVAGQSSIYIKRSDSGKSVIINPRTKAHYSYVNGSDNTYYYAFIG